MKKEDAILIAIVFAILLVSSNIIILNQAGSLNFLNPVLNNLFNGPPNRQCATDTDCAITNTNCELCGCGEAVNKDWSAFCPLKNPAADCSTCPQKHARCAQRRCIAVNN